MNSELLEEIEKKSNLFETISQIINEIISDRSSYLNEEETAVLHRGFTDALNHEMHAMLTARVMSAIVHHEDFIISQFSTMWMKFQLRVGYIAANRIFKEVYDIIRELTRTSGGGYIDDQEDVDVPAPESLINYVQLRNSDEARAVYKYKYTDVDSIEDWAKWIFVINAYMTIADMFQDEE